MAPRYLSVKNWEEFQHYKDRSPPWIKLHRELLRDYEFSCLQDASKLHLMLIWLLSSQLDNRIPNDAAWIQRQIGVSDPVDLTALIDNGFLLASDVLADCKQSAMPETETETERTAPQKPLSADALLFSEGKELLGPKAGGFITKLKQANGIEGARSLIAAAREKENPREWLGAVVGKLNLPKDNHSLWNIRKAAGLPQLYDDLETCHAEILKAAQVPEVRAQIQAALR